ncbi:protein kinase domain-containing protein [Streptomyces sp. NBC_01604]|uniref:protein kinase domain-containing protein n=1 Tax=Streptomyces sp. NBC_01604 TaxID=2975894 RepID=UPI00386A7DED
MAGETPDQGEGRVINGRYRLLRALGAGGMGRVWLAYDEELACEVAMKEIALPDVPMDSTEPVQRIARARSEARHAARLRGHPHVATVHDVVVHEGLPWIVMEYVPDAIDLQAVVRRSGPLDPAQAARIGLAVLDALTAGHRIGILHRDVKPANILLAPDSSGDPYARVLLTDYGIALQPESQEPRLTATAGILGTPGYLAPERARGEPPTPAADMFSLGATLYAAVEGRGPFDRHGDYATLTALLGEDPTPPVRAGELTPVLLGLLVKDPVRRFSPETVARGLERVVQGGAGPGAPPGWGAAPVAAAGFAAPPGGFGPPPEGFGAAPAGAGRSPEGHGAAMEGHDAMSRGHGGASVGQGAPPGGQGASPGAGAVDGPPPGYVASTPPGYVSGPPGGWGGGPAQGSPPLPGAPPTPNTPQTPHTQAGTAGAGALAGPGAGDPATPGSGGPGFGGAGSGGPGSGGPSGGGAGSGSAESGGPATPGGTPGPSAYDPWRQPTAQPPEAGNPYARAPGSPYASGGGPSPYGIGSSQSPYGSGSQASYGGSATQSAYPGGAPAQPGYGGYGGPGGPGVPGVPGVPGGQAPPPPSPGKKRIALVALVVAAVLVIAGGAWGVVLVTGDDDGKKDAATKRSASPSASGSQGSASAPPAGPVLPYGDVVGLGEPLEPGDCVQAVWSGTPFKSEPNLGLVDCAEDWPDGQVVAIDTAADHADARAQGAKRCENQTRTLVDALPDAAGYAVVPTEEGFTAAGGGTACLVLGRHAAIGGEVGRFRDAGTDLWVGQMSVGDCWVYEEQEDSYNAPLTDCAKPHTDQVIGSVQAPTGMTYKKGTDNATKLCGNKFESTWAPGQDRTVYGWVADQDDWEEGFNKVVCTVSRADNKKTTGKIPAPGAV